MLRVQLDLTGRVPAVSTALTAFPEGVVRTLWSQQFPLEAFGLTELGPPSSLRIPDEVRDRVRTSLLDELEGQAALWLRLAPPYGYLGAAPWEETLVPATGIPVLRVPDRLPAAADLGHDWTAAVALSAPPGSHWATEYLHSLVEQIDSQVPVDRQVHIFADALTSADLRDLSATRPWVFVHDPSVALEASKTRLDDSRGSEWKASSTRSSWGASSPGPTRVWTDWMLAGLAGHAVRSIHVVLDAAFDGDRPRLMVSPDPNQPVHDDECLYVSSDSLLRVADGAGAATLSVGSPPTNPADLATRMIVDDIGQKRAGPTIYSSIGEDPTEAALVSAHGYMADRSGEFPVPRHPSLFTYAQPEHVQASLEQLWPAPSPGPGTSPGDSPLPEGMMPVGYHPVDSTEIYYAQSTSVPRWVASSHRYLGNEWAGLSKSLEAETPSAPQRSAYDEGAAEALQELRSIIDRHSQQ